MNSYRASTILRRMEENSCLGKRAHFSMRAATIAAKIVGDRKGQPLGPYQCPFCLLFHVGHPPSPKRIQAERKLKRYGITIGRLARGTENIL